MKGKSCGSCGNGVRMLRARRLLSRSADFFQNRVETYGNAAKRCGVATIVIAVCLLPVFFPAFAQARSYRVVISGRVTDIYGRLIPSALVAVPALNESTLSDSQGSYRLTIRSRVRPGEEVVIRASRKGFDYASKSVRLAPGVRPRINFRLTPST